LRELKELDKWEQRFRIDDHLGRKESALRNLYQAGQCKADTLKGRCIDLAGSSRFEDAASYLARFELYDEAFKLYAGDQERLPVSSLSFPARPADLSRPFTIFTETISTIDEISTSLQLVSSVDLCVCS
jgi:hypothetical protein